MKVNISIDDVSPHQFSSTRILEKCDELVEQFPQIKFSLFIPLAYLRTVKPGTATANPLRISEFPDFCNELRNLDPDNYEIGYHGYFHGIPGKSDNDEFQHISYEDASIKADLMLEEVEKSDLGHVFKKMFRPPAWRMGPEAFRSLHDKGFDLFALTDLDYAVKTYAGSQEKYPSTISAQFPPFRELKKEEKCGIVYHACEWDQNFLDSEKLTKLIDFLNKNNPEFVFLKEFL